jgi:hypothetical protein
MRADQAYRSQEKEFHHEEHEEEKRKIIFSGFGPSSFPRVLRVLRGFIFLNPISTTTSHTDTQDFSRKGISIQKTTVKEIFPDPVCRVFLRI